MPGPRKEVSAVRFALSKDDLKTSFTPSESVTACSSHTTSLHTLQVPWDVVTCCRWSLYSQTHDLSRMHTVVSKRLGTHAHMCGISCRRSRALSWRHILRQCASDWMTLGPAIRKNGAEAFSSRNNADSFSS